MPKVDRWARLTVRLPAETYHRLEALAEEIPGITPNALIRLAVEQLTPQLEAMAEALKAARAGQRSNALELLVALAQASGGQASPPPEVGDHPIPPDLQATLAQMQVLQREQGQRLRALLDQPQGRALRQSLERLHALQQEQWGRIEEATEQPMGQLQAMLEWVRALQEEQARWLREVLTQPHDASLRRALEQVQALQEEQERYVQGALEQCQARQEQDTSQRSQQERFDAAAALHERWLDGGAGKGPETRGATPGPAEGVGHPVGAGPGEGAEYRQREEEPC